MNERDFLKISITLLHEELIFMTRGYKEGDRPKDVQNRIDVLNEAISYANRKVEVLNRAEFPDARN